MASSFFISAHAQTHPLNADPLQVQSVQPAKKISKKAKRAAAKKAREAAEAEKEKNEIDTSHDLAEHDPSPKTHLKLKKEMSQAGIIFTGVEKHIDRNVALGLKRKTLKSLAAWYPTAKAKAAAQVAQTRKHFSFHNAVEDESLFAYLKLHQHRYEPKLEFGPSLVNAEHELAGFSNDAFGFCWGFSTLNRYFSTLAFFDASLPREESLAFYKSKIDQIVRGEAVVIPGFANFREFSLVPEHEYYLKLNAMELWRSRAVTLSSLGIFLKSGKQSKPLEVEAMVSDLETRIARGELPKIIFSSHDPEGITLGMTKYIHVVLPYAVERMPNQSVRIHLWDVNFYTETLVDAPKYLEITPDHVIHYAPWHDDEEKKPALSDVVASVKIAPENNRETLMMMLNLKKFCSNVENSKYCDPASAFQ